MAFIKSLALQLLGVMIFLCYADATGPQIDASPTLIEEGRSEFLLINCSFSLNDTSEMTSLISITWSRAQDVKGTFMDLAGLNDVSNSSVSKMTTDCVIASGWLDPDMGAFIYLEWERPTERQAGIYKCSVKGSDAYGHLITLTKEVKITANKTSSSTEDLTVRMQEMCYRMENLENMILQMGLLLRKTISDLSTNIKNVQDIENRSDNLEQSMEVLTTQSMQNYSKLGIDVASLRAEMVAMNRDVQQNYSELDSDLRDLQQNMVTAIDQAKQNVSSEMKQVLQEMTSDLQNSIQTLSSNISAVDVRTTGLQDRMCDLATRRGMNDKFEAPLTYKSHSYYVSKDTFLDVNVSMETCKQFGGYLAEINDASEHSIIQQFLKSSGKTYIYIGGTDEGHEGTWHLPSTDKPMPYADWDYGEPNNGHKGNCLLLVQNDWQMHDWHCHYDTPQSNKFYMCEVPTVQWCQDDN